MTAVGGQQGRVPARRGPVFDMPPSPGRESVSACGLARIVDPAGYAVAWFDPVTARCVEFMVRSVDRGHAIWAPVFAGTAVQGTDWRGAGCEVLAAAGDSVPRIMGGASASDWPGAEWRLLQRDPTSVSLKTTLCNSSSAGTGNVDARLVARLDDAALSLALSVHNNGGAAMPVAFGLRAFFPPGLVHGSRLLVVRAGDKPVPLRLPADLDADGFAATSDRSQEKSLSPWDRTASGDASRLVVACDEGVHRIEVLRDDRAGNSALAFLGIPVQLEPGSCTGLAISMECW